MLTFTPAGTSTSLTLIDTEGDVGPYLYARPVVEELSTPGVDGRRYREVNRVHEPWERVCWQGHASYGAALTALRGYEDFSGQVGALLIVGPANDSRRVTALAELVQGRAMAAPIITPTGVSSAYVRSVWRFTLVEDDAT